MVTSFTPLPVMTPAGAGRLPLSPGIRNDPGRLAKAQVTGER
jgi:hypothetical protein